jgi:hypothetical protein
MNNTPEEKAKELVEKFNSISLLEKYNAKECAIIAVNEIINLDVWYWPHNSESGISFWKEVKEHIQNMK